MEQKSKQMRLSPQTNSPFHAHISIPEKSLIKTECKSLILMMANLDPVMMFTQTNVTTSVASSKSFEFFLLLISGKNSHSHSQQYIWVGCQMSGSVAINWSSGNKFVKMCMSVCGAVSLCLFIFYFLFVWFAWLLFGTLLFNIIV